MVTYSDGNDLFPKISVTLKGSGDNVNFMHVDEESIVLEAEIEPYGLDESSTSAASIIKISLLPLSILIWITSFQRKTGFLVCVAFLICAMFSGYSIAEFEDDTKYYDVCSFFVSFFM